MNIYTNQVNNFDIFPKMCFQIEQKENRNLRSPFSLTKSWYISFLSGVEKRVCFFFNFQIWLFTHVSGPIVKAYNWVLLLNYNSLIIFLGKNKNKKIEKMLQLFFTHLKEGWTRNKSEIFKSSIVQPDKQNFSHRIEKYLFFVILILEPYVRFIGKSQYT